MRVLCLSCTLKLSPDPSNTEDLTGHVLRDLEARGFETELIRITDHVADPGVISEQVTDRDEWPMICAKLIAADVLIIATPTWIGQPSSVSKRVLERMDAMLSETKDDDATPGKRSGTPPMRRSGRSALRKRWRQSRCRGQRPRRTSDSRTAEQLTYAS